MGFLPQCNSTLENETILEQPIWHTYTFHRIGLWISAITGIFAIALSFFLIFMHATHYLKPHEQRHIIRILFMVPVYAAVSFLSYYFYRNTVYFEVIRDCYEAFAIASFFSLLCHYLAQDLHQQKNYFRSISPNPWIWPISMMQKCCGGKKGIWRTPRSGLTWFNIIWSGVFQYCFIRVFMTIVAVSTQAFGRYCLESLNPAFSHVWVMGIEAIAVTIAMYCIIQFYIQVRVDIKEHRPLLKVLAIKLVIFLSFWQTIVISFLTSTGVIKTSIYLKSPDIRVGLPAMLLCIEMALFSIFHFWAFSYRPYSLSSKQFASEMVAGESPTKESYVGGFLGTHAMFDAFNPWDLIKAVGRSARWLFVGRKHRTEDSSYDATRVNTGSSFNLEETSHGSNRKQNFSGSTAYSTEEDFGSRDKSLSKPAPYGGAMDPEEGANLLSNAQAFSISHPTGARDRMDVSPYRRSQIEDNPEDADSETVPIGVAQTTFSKAPEHQFPQPSQSQSRPEYPRQESFPNPFAGHSDRPSSRAREDTNFDFSRPKSRGGASVAESSFSQQREERMSRGREETFPTAFFERPIRNSSLDLKREDIPLPDRKAKPGDGGGSGSNRNFI